MQPKKIVCVRCKREFASTRLLFECPVCLGPLDIEYDYNEIKKILWKQDFLRAPINHFKYWPFYPIEDLTKIVSLGEGNTPLVQSTKKTDLMFKLECCNPTGSFKDRGSAIEITKALELGAKEVYCASTGNMGASVSAYSTRAGIKANIFVPNFVPKQKISQIQRLGGKISVVKGSYDSALKKTKEIRKQKNVFLTGDYPFRGEGEKSVGFEIMDQLNFQSPDYIVSPIGNGTLISSTFKALNELKIIGIIKKLPRLVGVQAKNCNPVYEAWLKDLPETPVVKNPKTIAGAVCCGNPVDGIKALHAIKKTDGIIEQLTENEIKEARKEMCSEGLDAEYSGALAFGCLKKLGLKGKVILIVSGNGLKEF